ncbi:ommochrome-binding protein-like [Nymphalis io]|uniref:ommochrome-binding protein-like n=1 Tax=Inachis io TaxID=171585 RepID=UPI002168AFD8|nr:ommochrome-binding protein-like [Nymphalis io]XP_050357694.1 ommochrome-binding protein-like [Nymphalis io]
MLLFHLFMFCVTMGHYVDGDEISCNGLVFGQVYYDREVLMENLGRPYNLVVHKYSGTLFFSHTIHKGTEVDFKIMAYDLNKRVYKDVKGIPGGYAIAYDPGNDDIYFGGHDGIYKYNFLTKSAEFFAEEGKSIWGLFIRNNFYYIDYPTQKLHVYIDDKFVKVAEAVNIEIDNFFVTRQQDIYFSNKTALYKVDKITRSTTVLDDDIAVRQIADDSYGDIYICGTNGIYVEDKPYTRIKQLAEIENVFGMTFDEHDRVIYSDKYTIYRLLPSNNSIACIGVVSPNKNENAFEEI